jgi:hypothetical protein
MTVLDIIHQTDRTIDNVKNVIVILIYRRHKPIDSIELLGS